MDWEGGPQVLRMCILAALVPCDSSPVSRAPIPFQLRIKVKPCCPDPSLTNRSLIPLPVYATATFEGGTLFRTCPPE